MARGLQFFRLVIANRRRARVLTAGRHRFALAAALAEGELMTTTTTRQGGPTALTKGLLFTPLAATGVLATRHFAPGVFGGNASTGTPSSIPPRIDLGSTPPTAAKVAEV